MASFRSDKFLQALKLLADAYLKAGQPGPALNCVQVLMSWQELDCCTMSDARVVPVKDAIRICKCNVVAESFVAQALRYVPDGMRQEAGEGGDSDPTEEGPDSDGSPAVAYLALQALLALGRGSDAQAELLALASATDAPLSLCMSAVKVGTPACSMLQHHPRSSKCICPSTTCKCPSE